MNIIEKYRFGKMVIAGRTYNKDLIILQDEIIKNWWRKEGHSICLEDLEALNKKKVEILVIGKGASGLMKVPNDFIASLKEENIKVIALRTSEAVSKYNELLKSGKLVAGAFHLTC